MAGSSGCRNEKVPLLFAHSESVGPQRALGVRQCVGHLSPVPEAPVHLLSQAR